MSQSYNPDAAKTASVWANPISLATTLGITIVFFSSGYLDVSVLRVCFPCGISRLHRDGLPHSDICGSKVICTSPQLFAAYHVLLRLREPRHPPYALICFSITLFLLFVLAYSLRLPVNNKLRTPISRFFTLTTVTLRQRSLALACACGE